MGKGVQSEGTGPYRSPERGTSTRSSYTSRVTVCGVWPSGIASVGSRAAVVWLGPHACKPASCCLRLPGVS